ncbi:hypothetical protein ACFY4B_27050 [Kitasatospora sp. NPDC001261]|uniref:hypothetical protein n=1 Tax=Kitasatospora sp. NPDC001261 TaxID=3364012 RepID=UPI003688CB9C
MDSRIRQVGGRLGDMAPEEVVCAFAGEPAPGNDLARRLVGETLAALDQAPRGTLMIADLAYGAKDWPELPVTLPATPWEAVTLVDALAALVRSLTAGQLREAAAGLGLRRGELLTALLDALPDGPTSAMQELGLLAALADSAPQTWTTDQQQAVRKAVLVRLAALGDAFVRVTEHQPAPLPWLAQHGILTGCHRVAASPNILEAVLRREPDRSDVRDALDGVIWGEAGARGREHWRWKVGWRLPDGRFASHEGAVEATRAAAVFAAEQTVAELLRRAPAVRQRFTGRLLVPRGRRPQSAAEVEVVTLRALLLAVFNEDRDLHRQAATEGHLWPSLPHTGPDHQIVSTTAALFEHLGLPYPCVGEEANTAEPGTEAFDAFLQEHAVVLTPPARAYLAGLGAAGPGHRQLRERHASGLSAAVRPGTPEEDQLLVADLGPLPEGMVWSDLLDPPALERFLDEQLQER